MTFTATCRPVWRCLAWYTCVCVVSVCVCARACVSVCQCVSVCACACMYAVACCYTLPTQAVAAAAVAVAAAVAAAAAVVVVRAPSLKCLRPGLPPGGTCTGPLRASSSGPPHQAESGRSPPAWVSRCGRHEHPCRWWRWVPHHARQRRHQPPTAPNSDARQWQWKWRQWRQWRRSCSLLGVRPAPCCRCRRWGVARPSRGLVDAAHRLCPPWWLTAGLTHTVWAPTQPPTTTATPTRGFSTPPRDRGRGVAPGAYLCGGRCVRTARLSAYGADHTLTTLPPGCCVQRLGGTGQVVYFIYCFPTYRYPAPGRKKGVGRYAQEGKMANGSLPTRLFTRYSTGTYLT